MREYLLRRSLYPETLEERLRRFLSSRMVLYFKADQMRQKGAEFNHRKFGVGVAAHFFDPKKGTFEGGMAWGTGFNSKDLEHGIPRCCAERRLFETAQMLGYTQIVGMVIVAEYQTDDVSGIVATRTRPCHSCRVMMKHSPLVWDGMLILMALPPPPESIHWSMDEWDDFDPEFEVLTFRELLDIYQTA